MPEVVKTNTNLDQNTLPTQPEFTHRREDLGLVIKLKKAEQLGLEIIRGDNIESIIKEAEALGTIREIRIDDNRNLMVFTTVAASAHTPYVCNYRVFKKVWKEMSQKTGYQPPSDKLLAVKDEENAFIPLHFITWACVKTKDDQGNDVYQELDIFDLVGQGRRYDKDRDFTLGDLDNRKREEVLSAFWEELDRRMRVHSEILKEMYQGDILPKISEAINSSNLSEEIKLGLIQIFQEPGFPDNTVPIGHYSRYKQDKLGRGPQSNPNFHSHSAIYFFPEKIWEVIDKLEKTEEEKEDLFNQILAVINPALEGGEVLWLADLAETDDKVREKISELMMKQIDPYSTIFFKAVSGPDSSPEVSYLISKFKEILKNQGINAIFLKLFIHHTTEKRKGDIRFAEGIKLTIKRDELTRFLAGFNNYLNELYKIWAIVKKVVDLKKGDNYEKRDNLLETLGAQFKLPKKLLRLIKTFLQPVGGDLNFLPFPYFSYFKGFAQKELKGEKYLGYNIPGLPGIGITITENEKDNLVDVLICPLESMKGIGEQIIGLPIIR